MTEPSLKDPAHPVLIVIGGPHDGSTLFLESPGLEKLLGSGPDCHLRLEGSNVDHHHARVSWDEARGLLIGDVGSPAGTYVNGERIGLERVLGDGDRVCLGPPGSSGSVKLLARVPLEALVQAIRLEEEPFVLEDVPTELPPPAEPGRAAPRGQEVDDFEAQGAATAPSPPDAPSPPPPGVIFDEKAEPAAAKRPRAEVTELPSIEPSRSREAPAVVTPVTEAALKKLAEKKAGGLPRVPRALAWGGLAGILALGVFAAFGFLQAPTPVLSSALPTKAEPGGTLTLTGTAFSATPAHNTVRFGDQVAQLVSASETQLAVAVPSTLGVGGGVDVPVTVETRRGRSNALFVRIREVPQATALEPDVALPGEEVAVKGRHFEGKSLTISVGEIPAEVLEAGASMLRFRVPEMRMVEGRQVSVSVQVGSESARPLSLILGRLPLVTEVDPSKGPPGERVVIRGRGFDPRAPGNAVVFGNEPALILSASETELVVAAPFQQASGTQATMPVVVHARGRVSSALAVFTTVRLSTGAFTPRFFASSVPGDASGEQAFVSSELGPLLLLSGRDAAPSTAERAVRVATALNALFQRAGSRPVKLEAREGPVPVVAVAGGGEVLVRATAEDAEGYGRPLDPGMKGQRGTPAGVAAYWTALLQDFLTLFVQRERPTRVVELSSRGKTLLYLYSEAERRVGPGAGVPPSLVNPPAWTLVKSLREMALLLPAKGEATAVGAVVGRWEGTMDEKGVGERSIRLELRLDGTRLAGSLSTTFRQVTMDIPLEGVSYDKGTLGFSFSGGAGVRRFRGTVEGAKIAGTIQGPTGSEELGRFVLRYAE